MTKNADNITRSRRLSDLATRCADRAFADGQDERFWLVRCDAFLTASVEVAR